MNNIMQMLQAIKNPQVFIQQMMNDKGMANNPLAKNAFDMLQRGDNKGLEELAMNLCREKGINPEDALKQIKNQFGM